MIVKVKAHAPLSCDSVKCQCWPARVLYVQRSARLTAESLTKRSPIIKQLVDARQLKIAAAMQDITTGKVSWLS